MRGRSGNVARFARGILFGLLIVTCAFHTCHWLGLRINFSSSLPRGIYIQSQAGNLVEFCPVGAFAALSITRGYRDPGGCPDGGAPLLKPVVATSGDAIEVSSLGLSVNQLRIPNTAPLSVDTEGRPLQHWPFGQYIVQPATIWVASSFNGRSFDSRYFGPIRLTAIRDHLNPLLTF